MGCVLDLERFGERTAVVDDRGQSLTFDELAAASAELYSHIGKRVLAFALSENTLGSLVGHVSLIDNGAALLALAAATDREQLWSLIRTYRPSVLWMPAEMVSEFISHEGFELLYEAFGCALVATGLDAPELHEDLCQLLSTSGSTGSPKLVRQSYDNVRNFIEGNIAVCGMTGDERFITATPMYYSFCSGQILTDLAVGSRILVTDKGLMQREFWDFFGREGATDIAGVPYTFEMLDRLRFYRRELPSLRMMMQSGGKLAPELHEKLAAYADERGAKFIVCYGQCESSGTMAYLPPENSLAKKGSIGVVLPGCTITLVDDAGEAVWEPGVAGELVFRGRNVTMGYALCADDLAKGDEWQGFLETGDMATRDDEDYYYIVGRKKRFLKVYGNRVSLDEVDRIVASELGIECASAGEDDHVVLYVTDASKAEAAHTLVAERTRLYPGAFEVVVLDSIPKNETGKVLYTKLGK